MDHWLLDTTLPLVTFGAVCPKYSKTCSVTRSWELHCSSKFYSDQDLSTLVAMNGHSPTSRFWTSNKYNTISQRELNTHDHATVLHAVCATQHWMSLIFLKAWVHQMAYIHHISSHQVFEVKYETCTTVLLNYKNHRDAPMIISKKSMLFKSPIHPFYNLYMIFCWHELEYVSRSRQNEQRLLSSTLEGHYKVVQQIIILDDKCHTCTL